MHLCNSLLSRPSASSPLDNKTHPMAITRQALDLEGLHRKIHSMAEQMRIMNENNARLTQHLTTNNPPPPLATLIPEVQQSRRSQRTGDNEFQSHRSTGRARNRTLEEREGHLAEMTRRPGAEIDPPLRRSGTSMPVLTPSIQKETESLKDYVKQFHQAILEVEDPSDKVVVMVIMEGLRLRPLFDSLSKNVPETLSTLQSQIVASDLGNEALSNHHLEGFHCGGLPFAVQRDLRSPDARRNKGNHLNLSFEDEISHYNRDRREALRDEMEEITLVDPRESKNTKPLEEVAPLSIHPDHLDRHVKIRTELTKELRSALVKILKKNFDVFAWSQGDVPMIDPQGQALTDFVAESTYDIASEPEVILPEVETPEEQNSDEDLARWKLFVDGSSNQHGCGAWLIL
ncbi:hypothetical protein Acr_20g0006280 [Actinidia rufa]|uniref:Uncharacterized protein n=1 Tax=Actinidia rufa TaxID=165716 RepID=A0A7J0GDD1_9ERIC|nr:hypothetical protein Acr_20g0006280 [Actinidia rufa]